MKTLLKKTITTIVISCIGISFDATAKWSAGQQAEAPQSQLVLITKKTQPHVVQIFVSLNPTKAEGMKNTLILNGYPAFIKVKAEQQKSYYQVQIGPFSSRSLAYGAKTSITKMYPEYPFLHDAILKVAHFH